LGIIRLTAARIIRLATACVPRLAAACVPRLTRILISPPIPSLIAARNGHIRASRQTSRPQVGIQVLDHIWFYTQVLGDVFQSLALLGGHEAGFINPQAGRTRDGYGQALPDQFITVHSPKDKHMRSRGHHNPKSSREAKLVVS
jgi:hypothetical protein